MVRMTCAVEAENYPGPAEMDFSENYGGNAMENRNRNPWNPHQTIILVINSPYSKAEHIPDQKEWKMLMIALTGPEMQLAQLSFFP